MPAHQEQELLGQFNKYFSGRFASVYRGSAPEVLISQLHLSYIPIEDFKNLFDICSEIIEQEPVSKFIFDKRTLRAFHQPSMEWYFVHWKQEMYHGHGLKVHRKILPYEAWFKKCVEAGRHEITSKYPHIKFDTLDIQYASCIEEALRI